MYKKIIYMLIGNFLYSSQGSGLTTHHIEFPLFSIIPFIGILLSIALIPLVNHRFWESYYGKIFSTSTQTSNITWAFMHKMSVLSVLHRYSLDKKKMRVCGLLEKPPQNLNPENFPFDILCAFISV